MNLLEETVQENYFYGLINGLVSTVFSIDFALENYLPIGTVYKLSLDNINETYVRGMSLP